MAPADTQKQFIAVVHKDPDSAYGVHFPDVPGCFSAADEFEDLVAMATEALATFFDPTETIPEPRTMEVLRSDIAIQSELESGAFLLPIPLPPAPL